MPRIKLTAGEAIAGLLGRLEIVQAQQQAPDPEAAFRAAKGESSSPIRGAENSSMLDYFLGIRGADAQHPVFRRYRSEDPEYQGALKMVDEGLAKNSHIRSCVAQIETGLIGEGYNILPSSNTPNALRQARLAEVMLKQVGGGKPGQSFLADIRQQIRGGLYGICFHTPMWELVWWDDDGRIKPFGKGEPFFNPVNFKHRHPSNYIFDALDNPRFLSMQEPIYGEALSGLDILVHRFAGDFDNVWGDPWFAGIAWEERFMRWALRDWVAAAERVAWPIPVASPPPGKTMNAKEAARAAQALKTLKNDSSLVNADGFIIDNLENQRTTGAEFILLLLDYLEGNISKALLGQRHTIDPGQDGSNRSLGDHLVGVARDRLDTMILDLEETWNWFLKAWCEINFPNPEPPLFTVRRKDHRDIDQELAIDESLLRAGADQRLDLYYERYGRELPVGPILDPSDPTGESQIEIPDFGNSLQAMVSWYSLSKQEAQAQLMPETGLTGKDPGPAPGQKNRIPKRPGAKEGQNSRTKLTSAYRQ